jgi:outer membrane protein assembly factor BamB
MDRRLSRRGSIAGLAAAALSGCLQLQQTDDDSADEEPTDQPPDAESSPTEATTTTQETTVADEVTRSEAWQTDNDTQNVALGESRLYVPHPEAGVVAFDRASGEQAWRALADREYEGVSNFLPRRTVVVPGDPTHVLAQKSITEHALFQIDDTGSVVGRRVLDAQSSGLAATSAGLLLDTTRANRHEVEREDGTLYCDNGGGAVEWLGGGMEPVASVDKPDAVCGLELLDTAGRYALFDGAYVRGVHADSGLAWKRNQAMDGAAVTADERTFLLTTNEGLLRVDPDDGSTLWSFRGYSGGEGLAAAGDSVYIAGTGLTAVDAADGTRQWRQSIDGTVRASPVVTGRGVWVLTDEVVALFDVEDGSVRHRGPSPDLKESVRFLVDRDQIVVASEAGITLYDIEG